MSRNSSLMSNQSGTHFFFVTVIGSVVVATLVRLMLSPLLGPSGTPYVIYFLAVFVSSWLFGLRGGIVSAMLSLLVGVPLFLRPTGDHGNWKSSQFFDLTIIIIEWIVISYMGHMKIEQQRRADEKSALLQANEDDLRSRARRADSLNRIGKAVREMKDPDSVHAVALQEVAATLAVHRCLVILLDRSRDSVNFASEWHIEGLSDLVGEYSLADFDVDLDEIFPHSSPLVVPDVDDRAILSEKSANMLKSLQIHALLDVPMSRNGEIVSILGAYMYRETRNWTPDEISYVESVASQLTAAFEATRILTDTRNRAEREALINNIGEAMRITVDPEEIQEKAVSILGQALNADRCYFAVYDLLNSEVRIGRDWHRDGLKSVYGTHVFNNTTEMFNELYPVDSTSIVVDRLSAPLSMQTKENMVSLQIRSRVSVAVADTRGMATLTACMSDTPREWTVDDIQLIEKVASQLRISLEMAKIQSREHRIAADLQAALLPSVPSSIPGLHIGTCMQPALDEAEIGGDFFDVFPLKNNRYALVVGDVSGKGLAAAGQLAMVRNCLRMSFYEHQEPGKALQSLNLIITANELLSGFVTVVAMVYNEPTAILTCASAGHEPAIILRAEGKQTNLLELSGLPLGVAESAIYVEHDIKLNSGDILAMYTDGLSESGPTRREMLSTAGLARLVAEIDHRLPVAEIATNLVGGARRFANGTLRDDACVLVARKT